MLCFVALIIFGLLGIFSASHRELAREAAKCVFRRITFRPCNTTFQDKAKGKILGWLLRKSPILARIFNKYSEVLSWIFIILMVWSTVWVARGAYNFYAYGSCNGLNSSSFCVFDPTGKNNQTSSVGSNCRTSAPKVDKLTMVPLNLAGYPLLKTGDKNKIVFIGCYSCDYTREAYPWMMDLMQKYPIDFTFIHFPVKEGTDYLTAYAYCAYNQDKEKFWRLNELLFNSPKASVVDKNYTESLIKNLGFDLNKVQACVNSEATKNKILDQYEEIKQTGIFGTPTIFINGQPFVGPKPERVYQRALIK